MKFETAYFHCGDQLKKTLATEIAEVEQIVGSIVWDRAYSYSDNSGSCKHQTAYNKAFAAGFRKLGWEPQPLLRKEPKLIGDSRKGLVFVEIQFGNSSTLYRDYYKFQYGLLNGLLSLAVLIVPTIPKEFFPTRPKSVQNMAEYALARTYLSVLPINVPTLLIGLLPRN
ncbi:MAG: BglII/BstYI family type II restriction endonuclease [Dehalococcoidia bacterium]